MKKILIFSLFTLFLTSAEAQIDLKINPLGVIFSSPDLSAEYAVRENIGIDLSVGVIYGSTLGSGLVNDDLKIDKSGYRIRLSGKYYFNPDKGIDKFYAGAYLGPRSNKLSGNADAWGYDPGYKVSGFTIGLLAGYKIVSKSGILFEIGIGFGRTIGQKFEYNDPDLNTIEGDGFGLDGVGVLAVGYRIGGNK